MKLALPSSDTEDVHYDHARPYRRLLTAVSRWRCVTPRPRRRRASAEPGATD